MTLFLSTRGYKVNGKWSGRKTQQGWGDSIGSDLEAQRLAEAIPGGLGVDVSVAGDAEMDREVQPKSYCEDSAHTFDFLFLGWDKLGRVSL